MSKVKFGLQNVYIAKRTELEDGTVSYETPKHMPGAVKLSVDASGDSNDFYADNIKYFSQYANSGYTGSLEVADVPAWFKKEFLGYVEDTRKHIIETGKIGSSFAIMFQLETDVNARKFTLFNCTCSRPSQEFATTEDTITPATSTLDMTSAGETLSDGTKITIDEADDQATDYANYFDACTIPTLA